jgi:hypothetical protein
VPELDVSLFVGALITSTGDLTIFNLTIFKMVFLCFPVILLRGDRPGVPASSSIHLTHKGPSGEKK